MITCKHGKDKSNDLWERFAYSEISLGDQKLDSVESFILEIEYPQVEVVRLAPLQEKLDSVESFAYLGDGISPSRGCDVSTIARIRSAWGKFR